MANQKPELELVAHEEGSIFYLQHGYPDSLVRWHYHEELELHLIVATQGKAFVGDYIGPFAPGHLVLTGPMLPHNWLSNANSEYCPLRDMVVQFPQSLVNLYQDRHLIELKALKPLLERARFGIEFLGFDLARLSASMAAIRDSSGLRRLGNFLLLLDELAHWRDYQLLSSECIQGNLNSRVVDKINAAVDFISENYHRQLKLEEIAAFLQMNPSYFSRFFRQATGHTVSGFVNRIRISRACQLLLDDDNFVSSISYQVGFNNLANFNRQFLSIKNMTPSEYKRSVESRHAAKK